MCEGGCACVEERSAGCCMYMKPMTITCCKDQNLILIIVSTVSSVTEILMSLLFAMHSFPGIFHTIFNAPITYYPIISFYLSYSLFFLPVLIFNCFEFLIPSFF